MVKIGRRISRQRYFFRMVIVFAIVSFIPALILSLIYYNKATSIISEGLEEAHNQYLKQIAASVDIVMDSIIHTAEQMATDTLYSEYTVFPQKRYYHSFDNHSNSVEVRHYYNYLELRRRIYEQLELRSVTNDYIHSIYFYDKTEREVFPSDGVPQYIEYFPDKDWLAILRDGKILPNIMNPHTIIDNTTKQKKLVLSIIYPVFESDGYFIFNIDINYLYNSIFEKLNWDEQIRFFAFSQESSAILYSPEEQALAVLLSNILQREEGVNQKEFIYMNIPWRLNSYTSPYFNWKYISMLNPAEYYSELKAIQINILIITGGILVSVAFLIVIFGNFLYKPVRQLTDFLNNGKEIRQDQNEFGELGQVMMYIKSANDEKLALESKLSRSFPASRERFLYQLLGGMGGTWEKISNDLEYFKINLKPVNLKVLIIEIYPNVVPDKTQEGENKVLTDLWLNNSKEDIRCETILFGPHRGVYIFNCSLKDTNAAGKWADKILARLKTDYGPNTAAGLSSLCPSITSLDRAFLEAEEALRFRLIFGSEEPISFSDLPGGREFSEKEDINFENFEHVIIQGETDAAISELEGILNEIQSRRRELPLQTVRHLYAKILSCIISAEEQSITLTDAKKISKEDFYLKLISLNDFKNIKKWLIKLTVQTTKKIGNFHKEQHRSYVERVQDLLEKEYGSSVNLNSISDKMGLNPFYLSKMFKEDVGINFTDYLTNIRIEKAKDFLKEDKKSVKEICSLVGYDSSNYFIRVFKKKTGKTPGEYKRSLKLEKLYD